MRIAKLCLARAVCLGTVALTVGLFVWPDCAGAAADGWTPQQKLDIVVEGMKDPEGPSAVCMKHGITEATYAKWQDQLMASADRIYDSAGRGIGVRELPAADTTVFGLGSEVVSQPATATPSDWRMFSSFRLSYAQGIERGAFDAGGSFDDWTLFGGASLGFQKGKDAFSFSFMTPLRSFDTRESWTGFAPGVGGIPLTCPHFMYQPL